jgi:hypothetical protein
VTFIVLEYRAVRAYDLSCLVIATAALVEVKLG